MSAFDRKEALKKRVLASLSPDTRFDGFVERIVGRFGLSESDAHTVLAHARSKDDWKRGRVPGHETKRLREKGPAESRLVLIRMEPGATVPRHRHHVEEVALCLSGRAIRSGNRSINPGDFQTTEAEEAHAWQSAGHVPCIMLLQHRVPA